MCLNKRVVKGKIGAILSHIWVTPKHTAYVHIIHQTKLIEIFISCDDFCKIFESYTATKMFSLNKKSHNKPQTSYSEMMTIVLFYHLSAMKGFLKYKQKAIIQINKPRIYVIFTRNIIFKIENQFFKRNYLKLSYFFNVNKNSNPPLALFLATMVPLWKRIAFLTMESPSPEPPVSRVRPSLIR